MNFGIVRMCLSIALVSFCVRGTIEEDLPIRLSLESKSPQLLLFEPLALRLALRNAGEEVIETTLGLERFGVETTMRVAYNNDKPDRWSYGWRLTGHPMPLVRQKIAPDQVFEYLFDCYWQNAFPVFNKKGTYTLIARWHGSLGPEGTAGVVGGVEGTPIERDATIEITVVEGTESDKKCLEYMLAHKIQGYLSLDAKEFLFVDTRRMSVRKTEKEKTETLDGLHHVAKNFQDSRYSNYALATLLSVVEEKSVTEDLRKKILALAEEHVAKKTSPKQMPHSPHPRVLYTYALYLSKESPERALTLLEQAKTLNPDFVAADRIEKLAAQISWEQKTKDWTPEDFLKYREQQEAEKKRKEEEENRKQKTK